MQKIVPHLWFDAQAKQAVEFYTSFFPDSKITSSSVIKNTPSGDCDILSFELMGFKFMAISLPAGQAGAGPYFKINPSISFMVNFDPSKNKEARTQIDELWERLMQGGKALMPLDKYPFSERYGWVQDQFGVSWQLILTQAEGEGRPPIMPSLLFVKEVCGKAEEASDFYLSVFKNAPSKNSGETKRGTIAPYGANRAPDKEGTVMFTDFMLQGQWFVAMDSAQNHPFGFSEALSFVVQCDTQEEIDYYWGKLSAVPEAEQCGWLKDRFGVSWQVVPTRMQEMMEKGTQEQMARVTECFLKMKKFDLAELERAYEGK